MYTVYGQQNTDSLEAAIEGSTGIELLQVYEQLANGANTPELKDKWGSKLLEEAISQDDAFHKALGYHYQALAKSIDGQIKASNDLRMLAIETFESIDRRDKMARQYISIGNNLADLGLFDSSLIMYERGKTLAIESQDSAALSGALLNISTIHHERGDEQQELAYLFQAHDLAKERNQTDHMAVIQFNIAVFYTNSGDTEKAKKQAKEVLALYKKQGNLFGESSVYNLFAQLKFNADETDSALYYLDLAMANYQTLGDRSRVAFILMNQGQTLGKMQRWDEAKLKLEEALTIYEEIEEPHFAAQTLSALSAYYEFKEDFPKAIELLLEAISISHELGAMTDESRWLKMLADLYNQTGETALAYKALEDHIAVSDSLDQINKQEAIQEMEARYQNEKKQLEIDNLEKETALQTAKIEKDEAQRYALILGLVLALLMIISVSYAFVQKRKDNKLIQAQKEEVEQQHEQLEEKNREITDSIQYAKRIQTAILPPNRIIDQFLPGSFILYKPKDIVAGDFYWLEVADDTVFFAAADCTGHGVPGAMVSVICNNGLNRSVREFGLRKPSDILDKTRELVIKEFEKSDEEVKDGMDISLCAFHQKTGELLWAGANNPLWIVRKGVDEIEEVKADKQPIGKYALAKPFTNHTLTMQSGDSLYLSTDGFPDQFGGERGKKYKSGNFKKFIIRLSKHPIEEQRSMVDKEFLAWRGDHEQVDDVCVIGLRV